MLASCKEAAKSQLDSKTTSAVVDGVLTSERTSVAVLAMNLDIRAASQLMEPGKHETSLTSVSV